MPKPIILILLFLLLACAAQAQDEIEHLSPFAHGAGRTYALSARGLDAVGLNPSLLALGTPRPFEVTLIPISSMGVDAGPSFAQINSIATGFQGNGLADTTRTGSITRGDATRESDAGLLSNNKLSSTADARVFGLSYFNPDFGGIALTWTMHAAIRASIPNALLDYIGVGALARLSSGYQLTPQQLDIQGQWYSEYTLTYARTLLGTPSSGDAQLLSGIGVKYLSGIATISMDPTSEFSINDPSPAGGNYNVGVNYRISSAYPDVFTPNHLPNGFSTNLISNATAGSGFGADIGFTLGAFDSAHSSPWQVAISVSDIGSIQWNKNVNIRTADTTITARTTQGNTDTINAQLKALGGKLDTTAGSFTTKLPTTLHVAGALDLSQIGLTLDGTVLEAAAEFALGLTDVVGSPNHGRFGFAVILDHPGSALSFHTALGFTTQDGIKDLTFAFGIGIANRILIDAGTDGLTALFTKDGHTDAVFGLKVLL